MQGPLAVTSLVILKSQRVTDFIVLTIVHELLGQETLGSLRVVGSVGVKNPRKVDINEIQSNTLLALLCHSLTTLLKR